MLYYLSQFFSFLAMPLTLVFLLLIFGYWKKDRGIGKAILLSGIGILLFFSNQLISNWMMHRWEPEHIPYKEIREYPLGIVLTGVTNLNKTADDRTFFNKGADRVTHAVQLYKLGKIERVLITGGQGFNPSNNHTEADLLKDVMIMAGVPEDKIWVENQARNTHENAKFTKELLSIEGFPLDERALLITSAFHMKRAKGCFDKVGLSTDPFPVDYYAQDPQFTLQLLLIPYPFSIWIWHKLFKEWIGIFAYKLAGYI